MFNNKGFTLIEILITMSIMTVVIFISSDFITTGLKSTRFVNEQQTAITNARKATHVFKKEIRGANSSEQGDYPIALIDEDEFIFYTDADDDGIMEKVRYYITGVDLMKEVTQPGASKDYSEIATSHKIASYLNNDEEALFTYFSGNHVETSLINEVRLININLRINVTPTIAPNDYYVTTDVNLRNLKDNL